MIRNNGNVCLFCLELLSRYNGCHGQEDDLEVVVQRTVGQVFQVHAQALEHLFHRIGISVVESGRRENAWTHQIDVLVIGVLLHNLLCKVGTLRTGTYE